MQSGYNRQRIPVFPKSSPSSLPAKPVKTKVKELVSGTPSDISATGLQRNTAYDVPFL